MENKVFSSEPYADPKSFDFFTSVKLNHVEKVKEYLNDNKYLVYNYDYVLFLYLYFLIKCLFLCCFFFFLNVFV